MTIQKGTEIKWLEEKRRRSVRSDVDMAMNCVMEFGNEIQNHRMKT